MKTKIRRWRDGSGQKEWKREMQLKRKNGRKAERKKEINPNVETERERFMSLLQRMSHKLHYKGLHNHPVCVCACARTRVWHETEQLID